MKGIMKPKSTKKKTVLHSGHRNRLKSKLLMSGDCCLEPHELLEILLFYSIPRINTNEIAHLLLDKFKTAGSTLSSSSKELLDVDGIGKSSASLIMALGEARRRLNGFDSDDFDEIYSYGNSYTGDPQKKAKYKKCVQSVKNLAKRVEKEGYYAVVITEKSGIVLYLGNCDNKELVALSKSLKHNLLGAFSKGVILFRYTKKTNIIPTNIELERVSDIRSRLSSFSVSLWEYFVVSGDCNGNVNDVVGAKDWE